MEYEIDSDREISVEIGLAVSEFEGRRPGSLPSLSATVNVDALNRLWETSGPTSPGVDVSFEYSESRITIESGKHVIVEAI